MVELYEIRIRPVSSFGTPLAGDTIFGQFCWQAADDQTLLEGGLERWLGRYAAEPFAVFSSAHPSFDRKERRHALVRPDLPTVWYNRHRGDRARRERFEALKEERKKKLIWVDADLRIDPASAIYATDEEVAADMSRGMTSEGVGFLAYPEPLAPEGLFKQFHNTINRQTGTTGTGRFAPFEEMASWYALGAELSIFVLINPEATDAARVGTAMRKIGRWGFGKNASTGQGRFEVLEICAALPPSPEGANGCYLLGPAVPQKHSYSQMFFTPFVRFGRHGDRLARSANPFKNPVLMVSDGAVLLPKDRSVFFRPFVGTAVTGVSKSMPETVVQGYSVYLPVTVEL